MNRLGTGVICVALTISGCAAAGIVPAPPREYQEADWEGLVLFTDESNAECFALAGLPNLNPIVTAPACYTPLESGEGLMIVPHPCKWPVRDGYAKMLCHELGHANGWDPDIAAVHGWGNELLGR